MKDFEQKFLIAWKNIKSRCNNLNCKEYHYYGGRGIKVLWSSFEEFQEDMWEDFLSHIEKYGKKQTTIDRIDNNGNYCKENCRWATCSEQNKNKRPRRVLTYKGKTQSIQNWSKELGIKYETIINRLHSPHTCNLMDKVLSM